MEQNNNLITIDILMIVQIINFFILVYIFRTKKKGSFKRFRIS